MNNINYYIPGSDSIIVKEKPVGEGIVTISQNNVSKGTFGVNDFHNTTINLTGSDNNYSNEEKQKVTDSYNKTNDLSRTQLTFTFANNTTQTLEILAKTVTA